MYRPAGHGLHSIAVSGYESETMLVSKHNLIEWRGAGQDGFGEFERKKEKNGQTNQVTRNAERGTQSAERDEPNPKRILAPANTQKCLPRSWYRPAWQIKHPFSAGVCPAEERKS